MKPSLIPIDEAREKILSKLEVLEGFEICFLENALGKVLAKDIHSTIDVPPSDNSAMDGVLINFSDYQNSLEKRFRIESLIQAGDAPENLSKHCAARIFTGAILPDNADTVIPVEDCRFSFDNTVQEEYVEFVVEPIKGNHVRPKAQDIKAGQKVFSKGRRLKAQDIALLAALGLAEVPCKKPLRVGVVSTGNELLKPGEANQKGKIFNSNQYMLLALLKELSCEVILFDVLEDDFKKTASIFLDMAVQCDCIISTGGVSVGGADFVKPALESVGELDMWRLAIKPGKPFTFAHVSSKPFFGLPGNPVAVFVTFMFLVKPGLLKMAGAHQTKPLDFLLPAGFTMKPNKSRQEYLRVFLETREGKQYLRLFENQSSGVLSSLSDSDGLAIVPVGTEVKEGQLLRFIPYSSL